MAKQKDSTPESFNMDSFLNFDTEKLIIDSKSGSDVTFYRPNIIKENVQSYEAVLKFLYNPLDPNRSIINKWVVWLKNPSTDEGKYIDCPSSINKKSILQDAFFACRSSDKASVKELQGEFKRTQQFFSLVQIVQDKQHPELEGQIRIYQYGVQIYDKIKAQIKPDSTFKEPNNPFDVFSGHLFHLSIKIENSGNRKFPRYTTSEFIPKTKGLVINGTEYKEKNKDEFNIIHKHLLDSAPKLDEHAFKEWNEETTHFVLDAVNSIIPEGPVLQEIKRKNRNLFTGSDEYVPPANVAKKVSNVDLDLDDDDDEIEVEKPTKKPTKKEAEPVDNDDDDDDFFNDI